MVTKGLDGCLFVYENTEWKILEEKLKNLPYNNFKITICKARSPVGKEKDISYEKDRSH